MGTVLEVSRVTQKFRTGFWLSQIQVLHGIDLAIPEKSVFGFLGANGAGKTTLIHLMTGLMKPTSGSIRVFGFDAHSVEAKSRIGYLPERPYFYDHLTGEGLLGYFGALAGLSSHEIKSRIPSVLSSVGMSEARKVELKRYSKGMLQRIGIAQALIHDPELLILDEPMSGLDPIGRKEMRELILRLASEGRTVFFSSHVIPDVEAICNEVALIHKGKLIGCGPIGEFLAQGPLQTEIAFKPPVVSRSHSSSSSLAGSRRAKATPEFLEWREFHSLKEMHEGFRGIVQGQHSVNEVLAKLLKQKAQVLWVNPVRPSLEELFSRKIKEGSDG